MAFKKLYGTGNYLNGKRHGKFIRKNQKNEVVVTNFKMGEKDGLHGRMTIACSLVKEMHYKNDKLNGPYKYFNDHGQIT